MTGCGGDETGATSPTGNNSQQDAGDVQGDGGDEDDTGGDAEEDAAADVTEDTEEDAAEDVEEDVPDDVEPDAPDGCQSDDHCEGELICDQGTGECIEPECTAEGEQGECEMGELCLAGRCQSGTGRLFGGFCAGCGVMSSDNYMATGVVAPVEIIGSKATSDAYQLESGTLTILREQE